MADDAQKEESSTFVFADLAGFTALTVAHGDWEATEIATRFADQVRVFLRDYDCEEVKTIGDEVMIRVANPVEAVHLGLRIVEELARSGAPPVRVGMHTGAAVSRDGDWYGGTVNLASRVAGAARPGEVLMTEKTRQQIEEGVYDFELEQRGSHRLRHIPDPVPMYRAVGAGHAGHHLEIDPVCRMTVDPANAAGVRRRRGFDYYFCSDECQRSFDAEARLYIASSPAARVARKGFLINLTAFIVLATSHLLVRAVGPEHQAGSPWLLTLYVVWASLLVVHYRAVRRVL